MRHNIKLTASVLGLFFAMIMLTDVAHAESPREQLQQLIAQLQRSPDSQATREKIIALALTLNPKPATPDAATMAEGAAEYAFKNAKTNADYSDAAKQYEKALLLAPWLADDYFNCGIAHEKAGENKEAIRSFNLYLLASPNANDALAIKKRIGGLQYAAQKAEDDANRPANKDAVPPPSVIVRYVCVPAPGLGITRPVYSFDFSTHIMTTRDLAYDGSESGSYLPLPFQEAGSHLTWTTPPPDRSVSNGFRVSLDRDTGVLDNTDPFGRLFLHVSQCSISQR